MGVAQWVCQNNTIGITHLIKYKFTVQRKHKHQYVAVKHLESTSWLFLLVLLFFECLYQQVGNSCHPFSIKSHNLHFVSFWLYCPLLLFNNGSFSNNMLFLSRNYIKVVIIYINIRLWYFQPLSLPIKMLVQSNNEVIET